MTQNFKWLDRRIAAPGPYLTLVLSEAEFLRAMKDCGIKHPGPWIKTDHADATCHYLTNGKKEAVAVVALRDTAGRTAIEVAGLLVHEAVHVWQDYCARIGEHSPAVEQQAYGIQSIAQELMAEYARRVA
jgi:hypothetical protein